MNEATRNTPSALPENAVAIVGMAGRFPGAPDIGAFWKNLCGGIESLRRFDDAALAAVPPSARTHESYVPVRGVLDDVDRFDAAFFGIGPREAEAMDPQHRLFLECCWHALEDAGRVADRRSLVTGVFAGQSLATYLLQNLCHDRAFIERITAAYQTGEFPVLFGNDPAFLATRVAHKLDLRGPAVTVQTACSTSLVAVAQAVQSLLTHQCDLCLAGGVSISFPQERGHVHQEGSMVSPDGHCRPFDAEAAGTVFGSGVGVVVLRRLEDAVAAGDRIHAVIRGVAINNDGADKSSYSAPSVAGQREAIVTALTLADVAPSTIGYVEAHGTGTPLGDPIEFEALSQAFRDCGAEGNAFCTLGSLKSNIGHLEAAAGVAGLIKAALVVRDGYLPPTLHFNAPNPHIDLATSPFRVEAVGRVWPEGTGTRRAGVSSFGVGGTNAHVVLEEPPASLPVPPLATIDAPTRPAVLLLSAKTDTSLRTAAATLATHLEASDDLALEDVAHTLAHGRQPFARRTGIAAYSREQAIAAFRSPGDRSPATEATARPPRIVFMFPGQGAQRAGMLRDLHRTEPLVRDLVDRCALIASKHVGGDLRDLLLADPDDASAAEELRQTRITQPALFVTELVLARLWQSWGVQPDLLVGHSVGEYVAACLADVASLEDTLAIVSRRGALVHEQPRGSMLAVRLDERELETLIPADCAIAAVNAPGLCVVAGPDASVTKLEVALEKHGRPGRRLVTSHAFHSQMMDAVVPALAETIAGTPLRRPKIPIVSTVSGRLLSDDDARDPHYWARHARRTVRFADALAGAIDATPTVLIEVGPGTTLSQLARLNPAVTPATAVITSLPFRGDAPDGAVELAQAAVDLWCRGVPVDWRRRDEHSARRIVSLPGYSFADTRYWIAPPTSAPEIAFAPAPEGEPQSTVEPSSVEIATAPDEPRLARLQRETLAMLEDVSGGSLGHDSLDRNLLDLGFDSLLLAQVSSRLRERFGVTVSFRQLMERFGTPDALARHLDETLPPDPVVPRSPTVATAQATPPASAVEQLVRQQLELMRNQLALLESAGAGGTIATTLRTAIESAGQTSPARPGNTGKPETTPESAAPARHGPFRPVEKKRDESLTERQRAHIAELIATYCARTGTSKHHAAEHRTEFCDPRSISGFNPLWKEMVYPLVCERSKGPRLWDVDGNEYIDITMGFGVNYLGHSPDFVSQALRKQIAAGYEIGPQTPLAGETARMLCRMTGMERATFCNTGSEAVMAAMRVARTVTGRDRVVVFSGDYHGMFDSVLVRGVLRNGKPHTLPIAPGIPRGLIDDVTVLEYGADASLEWIAAHARELAAVIVEPVQSRNPGLQPREFLHRVREITAAADTALVFDEVITGFHCHQGGAQAWFGVRADMATYGKVIGGGMPIGALAGSRKWMDALDGGHWNYGDDSVPEVGVTFFAGTFVRHPLAVAAAHAALTHLEAEGPELQERVNRNAARLVAELETVFTERGVDATVERFASVLRLELSHDYKHAGLFFFHLRLRGIHFWEGRVAFLSTTHTDADIDRIVVVVREAIEAMQEGGFLPQPDGTTAGAPEARPRPYRIVEKPEGRHVPLTEEQHEIWTACQLGDAASANFNESGTLHLAGAVDERALRLAVQDVVARHEALRSVFLPDGSAQCIRPRIEVPIETFALPTDPVAREAVLRAEASRPFDLVRGPLVRFLLDASSPGGTTLVFTAHHLACDGWSYDIVVRELARCYSARVAGTEPLLPTPVQISAFAAEAPLRRHSVEGRAAQEYWKRTLAELPEPPALPEDFARPENARFNGDRTSITIAPETLAAVEQFARGRRATLFATLYATFGSLVHRLSGTSDFLVGVPMAGQNIHDVGTLVGHCVHFLPTRHRVNPTTSFGEHVDATSAVLLEAFEHAHVSFGTLLRELHWRRDPSRPSPLGITFNLDPSGEPVRFEGLELALELNPRSTINAELCFNLLKRPEGLVVQCDYCTDLFARTTIVRWLRHFETLLRAAVASPATIVSELPLLEPDQSAALADGTPAHESASRPGPALLHGVFEAAAERALDSVAVIDARGAVTYGELDRRANQLARHLLDRGLQPGGLVALLFDRSVEFVVAVLAVLKTGNAFAPLDTSWPEERSADVLRSCGARLLLVAGSPLPTGSPADIQLVDTLADASTIAALPFSKSPVEVRPEQLAYVIHTSGSTGTPKGVMIEHRAISTHVASICGFYGLRPDDRSLLFHSTAFDPTVEQLFCAFHAGASILLRDTDLWSGAEFAARVKSADLSVVDVPPRYLHEVLQELQTSTARPDLGRLRLVVVGGEALSPWTTRLWRDCGLSHIRLVNCYGPTECSVTATCHTIPTQPCARELAGRVPIGRPHGPVRALVLDARLQPVPVGLQGELFLGGPTLARGYLGAETLTRERFLADPRRPGERLYRTGDLARLLSDGTLEFLGRIDRQVQIRGYRVELAEVENHLSRHPCVEHAVALDDTDTNGSTTLVAFVVPAAGTNLTPESLRDHLAARLPDYMLPARYVVVARIPTDPNGKVDAHALRRLDAGEGAVAARDSVPPRNAEEEAIAEIWRKLLGVARVGVHDDFFELGGHSLLAMQMLRQLDTAFGVAVPLASLLSTPTIEGLARLLPLRVEPEDNTAATARSDGAKAAGAATTVVESAPALLGSGAGTPLFNIPGVLGYGLLPPELIAQIQRDRPYFDGLQLPGADGREPPLESIDAIADHLVSRIRAVRPHGPYALTGYCFGGVVAYEVANRLADEGETVQALVLWHAFPWHTWRLHTLRERLRDFPDRLRSMTPRDRWLTLKGRIAGPVRDLARRAGFAKDTDPGESRSPVLEANNRADEAHRITRPYHGRLYVARAAILPPESESPPLGGWEAFARGPLKIHDLRCEHLDLIKQPWLTEVSKLTAQWLRMADSEPIEGRPRSAVPADGVVESARPFERTPGLRVSTSTSRPAAGQRTTPSQRP
jgi:amino acid adenylation domain-containing protein